jgi:hypothetical protein
MKSQKVDIDRISFTGRVLDSGADAGGADKELDESNYAKPTVNTNQLSANEFQAIVSIKDTALRRNIERENFEDTLIDLLGEAVGRDLEEFAIFGNTDFTYAQDHVLSKADGWAKLAANAVYGGDKSDFDPALATYPETMFEAQLAAIPKEYLTNSNMFRFWVNWTVQNKYRNILKARGTALGDMAYTKNEKLWFKGIEVKRVPMLERAKAEISGGAGDISILGYPNNHAWGVFHKISIEREREAKKRQTDFVLTIEADMGFEDENACVVAYEDKSNPGS